MALCFVQPHLNCHLHSFVIFLAGHLQADDLEDLQDEVRAAGRNQCWAEEHAAAQQALAATMQVRVRARGACLV